MASNPHSDFTTHRRTLPTLSNLQLSPHILHLAKAGWVWCRSSCKVPTATGHKVFSALCKLGKSVPFQCCRRWAHDRMPPDNKLCSNYWHWHSSRHLHKLVAHLVIEILLLRPLEIYICSNGHSCSQSTAGSSTLFNMHMLSKAYISYNYKGCTEQNLCGDFHHM